jgi:hypothetical protein
VVKLIPGPGWIVAGFVAGLGTWAIGQVALRYFEYSRKLNPEEMKSLYQDIVQRRS